MPMNQPFNAMSISVAGAAQMRMKKYARATSATPSEQGTTARTAVTNRYWIAQITKLAINAIVRLCVRILRHSPLTANRSPLTVLPYACAVSPEVPTRRKPKFQYSKSKSIVPMAIPPIAVASLRCPTIAVSTMPTSGIVIFANILGIARRNMSLFTGSTKSSAVLSAPSGTSLRDKRLSTPPLPGR